MQPRIVRLQLPAAADTAVCLSQTPGSAGNLLINGTLASAGVADLTNTYCQQRQLILTFAGDETGHNFTVYGTVKNSLGHSKTAIEAIAGTAPGIVVAAFQYATITRIAIDAAATGAIKVGTNGVGSTPWINANQDHESPFNVGFGVDVDTGSVNFTVEHTWDPNPEVSMTVADATKVPSVFPHSSVVAKSAKIDGNYAYFVGAYRLTMNSGTGRAKFGYGQSGIRGN